MTDRQIIEAELKYTEADAARAFEWLRSKALDTNAGARCAAIMLAEVAKLKERDGYVQGGWIPVIEHLPKPYETVAIIAEMPHGRSCGWLNSDGTWMSHDHGSDAQVTHWLPLPEDPARISNSLDSKK